MLHLSNVFKLNHYMLWRLHVFNEFESPYNFSIYYIFESVAAILWIAQSFRRFFELSFDKTHHFPAHMCTTLCGSNKQKQLKTNETSNMNVCTEVPKSRKFWMCIDIGNARMAPHSYQVTFHQNPNHFSSESQSLSIRILITFHQNPTHFSSGS